MSRPRILVFSTTVATAVGLGTLPAFTFGVLAPFLRDEFALSRSGLGLLTTVFFVVGAPASLLAGKVVDAAPSRSMARAIFLAILFSALGMAMAPSYGWLLVASALAGIPLGLGNPGTNKLVARFVTPGVRGLVMGVKQSGVQVAALLAGAILPGIAKAWGWRIAIGLTAIPALVGLVGTFSFPRQELPAQSAPSDPGGRRSGRALKALAVYSFLMGAAMAAMGAYLPLYAEEQIGMSVTEAGALAASIGAVGTLSRIAWGWQSERFKHVSAPLVIMGAGAVIATVLIAAAASHAGWLLWPATILVGATGASWMAVAMLAVVTEMHSERTGRASGIVIFGFFLGCTTSPSLFGYSVDVTQSYLAGWVGVGVAFGAATLIALRWRAGRAHETLTSDQMM